MLQGLDETMVDRDERDEEAGQECELAIREADLIILTLSVTSPSTLEFLRKTVSMNRISRISYWAHEIRSPRSRLRRRMLSFFSWA